MDEDKQFRLKLLVAKRLELTDFEKIFELNESQSTKPIKLEPKEIASQAEIKRLFKIA